MTEKDELVARLEGAQFTTVRGRSSYDMVQVDDFLDGLVVALRQGRPVEPLIDLVRFGVTRFREGYETTEVDAFLAEVSALSLGEVPPAATEEPEEAAPQAHASYVAAPQVVQEQPGLFAGLVGRLFKR